MTESFIIGLDFGTDSARGVLVSVDTGLQVDHSVEPYPHGTLSRHLPNGDAISGSFFLQVPADYVEVATRLLRRLGEGRNVASIGIDFTASSPLPALADGTALADLMPGDPHAYVKLWKHAAQAHADGLLASSPLVQARFGGRLSGEWLLAKALQLAADAPDIFARADRFIEAGDWLVWQLTGNEMRSGDFAAYKAQFDPSEGYPRELPLTIVDRLGPVAPVGTSAGCLTPEWAEKTGILGSPAVAVAVIDSHAVLPAVNDGSTGTLTCAIGTSAAYLYLSDQCQPLPRGVEGVAFNAALADVWCYEAGQASYGDVLSWFVRTFPDGADLSESFAAYNAAAADLDPAAQPLLALDWWNGNRVPHSDSRLSGMLMGLTTQSSAAGIYRALMESLCFGTRSVVDLFADGGLPVEQVVVTSGLASRNPLLVQILADVLCRPLRLPTLENATCVGAAIHGAVAAGVVADFAEGFRRFGAREVRTVSPRSEFREIYDRIYAQYRALAADSRIHDAMHVLRSLSSGLTAGEAGAYRSGQEALHGQVSGRSGTRRDAVV